MAANSCEMLLPQPSDMHVHLRDGEMLGLTVPATARYFCRAMVMPNLASPLRTAEEILAYRERILLALPEGLTFEPLMTLYLTSETSPDDLVLAAEAGVTAAKLYPRGVTTQSEEGVLDLEAMEDLFEAMEALSMPLLVHAEDPFADPFDRERVFIENALLPLSQRFLRLKIVLEHVSSREGVEFVLQSREGIAATITPQHLLFSRGALFHGGMQPHRFCMPVYKGEEDRLALLQAATSGLPRFFLGTDSAPHPKGQKESPLVPPGVFSAPAALPIIAQLFAEADALDKLPGFVSDFGADFYNLPRSEKALLLVPSSWKVPGVYRHGKNTVIPLWAGETLFFRATRL